MKDFYIRSGTHFHKLPGSQQSMTKINTQQNIYHCNQAFRAMLAAIVVLTLVVDFRIVQKGPHSNQSTPCDNPVAGDSGTLAGSTFLGSGSTGVIFSGGKSRDYEGTHVFSGESRTKLNGNARHARNTTSYPKKHKDCAHRAVVTTIFEPTESVLGVAELVDWCLVIVGDTKTPDGEYAELGKKPNVVYLSTTLLNTFYRAILSLWLQSPSRVLLEKTLAICLPFNIELKLFMTLMMTMFFRKIKQVKFEFHFIGKGPKARTSWFNIYPVEMKWNSNMIHSHLIHYHSWDPMSQILGPVVFLYKT